MTDGRIRKPRTCRSKGSAPLSILQDAERRVPDSAEIAPIDQEPARWDRSDVEFVYVVACDFLPQKEASGRQFQLCDVASITSCTSMSSTLETRKWAVVEGLDWAQQPIEGAIMQIIPLADVIVAAREVACEPS
jgi:hypothetical protein